MVGNWRTKYYLKYDLESHLIQCSAVNMFAIDNINGIDGASIFSQRALSYKSLYIFIVFLLLSLLSFNSYALVATTRGESVDLAINGQIFDATTQAFPASDKELFTWLSQQRSVASVNMTGGAYWFYAEVRNESDSTSWVISTDGTLIEQIVVKVYQPERNQQFVSGYYAEHEYMLHYGKSINIPVNTTAKILIRFESVYYASPPSFELIQAADYKQRAVWENMLVLAAFGALLTLALYNLFIYTITRDRAFVLYSSYLIAYFLGWAFTFHVPAELFDWYVLELHYIPFFLLPILNTLFYLEFLQLKTRFPRLAAVSKVNIVLPLLLLPSCFIALSYAHLLATIVISIWLMTALVSGIACWRSGFHPARYFVLAFIALSIPGAIILPSNAGLMPDLVRNSELLTLLGGTLDAILLAFALADKIRLLGAEKDRALEHSNQLLALASTDHLTGIANRHAFDQIFKPAFVQPQDPDDSSQLMLVLIDIDGLKAVNDHFGHARGDELLCSFAKDLKELQIKDMSVYRLGGDEFTILAHRNSESVLRAAMTELEAKMHANNFEEAGISYGIAYASECETAEEMLECADLRMYKFKSSRRRARAQDRVIS